MITAIVVLYVVVGLACAIAAFRGEGESMTRYINVFCDPRGKWEQVCGWPHETRSLADAGLDGWKHGYRIVVRLKSPAPKYEDQP
jgi:hypothetical protein